MTTTPEPLQTVEHPRFDVPNTGALRGRIFSWLLSNVIAPGESLIDLGAGHCLLAKRARDAGFRVVAVDGRSERVPDDLGPDIEFVQADVRDVELAGYDVVAVLGLLYHMTLEDQLELLSRARGSTVIVDTQIHDDAVVTDACGAWAYQLVRRDGYEGVVFPENDNPMASIGNATSFWHTEVSLQRLFLRCGFETVIAVEPAYVSKYGARKFYVVR